MENCWILCNKCLIRYEPSIKMILSECGHILCEKCVDAKANKQECKLCKKEVKIIKLNEDMPEQTLAYFKDTAEECSELSQILKFQNRQLLSNINKLFKGYCFVKATWMKEYAQTQKMEKEIEILRNSGNTGSSSSQKGNYTNRCSFITSTPMSNIHKLNSSAISNSPFPQTKLPGNVHRVNQEPINSIQTVPNTAEKRLSRSGLPQPHHNTDYYKTSMNKKPNIQNYKDKLTRNNLPNLQNDTGNSGTPVDKKYVPNYNSRSTYMPELHRSAGISESLKKKCSLYSQYK